MNTLSRQVDRIIENNIRFFVKHAYDSEQGVFLSEINNQGQAISDLVHIIALSRSIYGLCESCINDIKIANELVDFLLKNMIDEDAFGSYFIPSFDLEEGIVKHSALNIWEQSYGFNGLVAYYKATGKKRDPESDSSVI